MVSFSSAACHRLALRATNHQPLAGYQRQTPTTGKISIPGSQQLPGLGTIRLSLRFTSLFLAVGHHGLLDRLHDAPVYQRRDYEVVNLTSCYLPPLIPGVPYSLSMLPVSATYNIDRSLQVDVVTTAADISLRHCVTLYTRLSGNSSQTCAKARAVIAPIHS